MYRTNPSVLQNPMYTNSTVSPRPCRKHMTEVGSDAASEHVRIRLLPNVRMQFYFLAVLRSPPCLSVVSTRMKALTNSPGD